MWRNYHIVRTTDEFTSRWCSFLKNKVKVDTACPTLYQYITDKFFRILMMREYVVDAPQLIGNSSGDHVLTYEEDNALRYAAGYIIRIVRKNIDSYSQGNNELMLSLDELIDDSDGGGYDEDDDSKDWVQLTNRGGLIQITDDAFSLFQAVEQVVRRYFRKDQVEQISHGIKSEIIHNILDDSNVKMMWSTVANDMKEEIAASLLTMIVDKWVTVRGFSFAGAWLELYKQRAHKSLQRSKSLRKVLYTDS